MKKLFISSMIFCTSVFFLCFLDVEQVSGAETLVVEKNQFEFREEPRVAEETLLGTLRAGSKVTWTGKTSGDWFEVRAPNGQLGWVHKSGLSAPKSRQEPTKKATPKPKSTKPRTVPEPKSDTLEKLAQLEKTNTQYEALLEEKDRRISELSGDLEELEDKLVNTAQLADDTKQLLEKEKVQSAEVQDTLQETLKQKDEELLAEKVEVTKLQNQLTALQEQTSGRSLQYLSYGLNLLLVLLLGAAGLLYVRQKRLDKLAIGADAGDQKNYIISKQYVSSGTPKTSTEQEKATYEHPGVPKTGKPAVVIPAASPDQEAGIAEEEDIGGEEVIIELSDVLPDQSGEIGEAEELVEEIQDVEIIAEGPEGVEELEEIEEVGEIEELDEVEEIEELGEVEEVEEIEEVEELEGVEEVEEVEELEEIEEVGEIEELDEVEAIEELGEVEEVEEIEELEEIKEIEGTAQPLAEELEEILEEEEEEEEEEGEEGGDFDFDYEEIYTEEDTSDFKEEGAEEEGRIVEVEGEKFEMLVEQNTQIIEPEETSEVIEESETFSGEVEEIEEIEEVVVEEVVEEVEGEDVGEVEEIVEVIEVIEEVEPEEAEFDQSTQGIESGESEQSSAPTLLEPSPILIEPEHEPVEPSLAKDQELISPPPKNSKGPKYDIELVNIGKNRKQILHILSKIEGLSKPPQELVDAVPSIIVRGAKEKDAKNFQVVMQKLGSDVRLIRK